MGVMGVDVHGRETRIRVPNDEGTGVVERRILTEAERLRKTFDGSA